MSYLLLHKMTATGRWKKCDHKDNNGGGGGMDSTGLYQILQCL
jgi:hypothetical protein